MVNFLDLPLELKLQIVEYDSQLIKFLILVDSTIYNYFKSIDGKRWLRRIATVNVDTPFEKGILIAGNIKDGQWNYYEIYTNTSFFGVVEVKIHLTRSEKYNFGYLYEIITYTNYTYRNSTIFEIVSIKDGQRDYYNFKSGVKKLYKSENII